MGNISIVVLLISLAVSFVLSRKMARYAQTGLRSGLTGAEVAAWMLRKHGIEDVQVTCTDGHLTDHYNPLNKTVNLSNAVYHQKSAAAAAVAAHECGHAVQHAQGYAFLRLRSAMVPALSVTSRYMPWVILLGFLVVEITSLPLKVGIGLFSLTTLFALVTLPVEFDASSRALAWMSREGVVTSKEYSIAEDALRWAALTYVVAALGSLAELLRLITMLNNRRRT
ncbi:MAG: zinc metallopeptidase [Bacteroidota bacterium]